MTDRRTASAPFASTLILAGLTVFFAAGSAHAAASTYQVDITVTDDFLGVTADDPHVTMRLTFDEANALDTTAASDLYFSQLSPDGSLELFIDFETGPNDVRAIGADSTSGLWVASGVIDVGTFNDIEFVLQLFGSGLTPDQIHPDFVTLNGGYFRVGRADGPFFAGNVDTVTLIPEPSTAMLVGLGLVGLRMARPSRRSSRR